MYIIIVIRKKMSKMIWGWLPLLIHNQHNKTKCKILSYFCPSGIFDSVNIFNDYRSIMILDDQAIHIYGMVLR